MLCIAISGQAVSRPPAPACGRLCGSVYPSAVCAPHSLEESPSMPVLRPPAASVQRLPSVCGYLCGLCIRLRSACRFSWRKRHQWLFFALQRHPCAFRCSAYPQRVSGQPPTCARLRRILRLSVSACGQRAAFTGGSAPDD